MLFTLQRYEFFSKSQRSFHQSRFLLRCCLPYKGTNFSANHNNGRSSLLPWKMLFTLQRYEFFSKSQRIEPSTDALKRCCLPYKGTNFSANHNPMIRDRGRKFDVVYPTKVRIFQQITTVSPCNSVKLVMLFTLQRYEFFSKSQRGLTSIFTSSDVVYPTKVRIFQQITTICHIHIYNNLMLFTLQRYEFFSKSQPNEANKLDVTRCCLPYKGTNFSANHNRIGVVTLVFLDVVYPTKVRIFQQITTISTYLNGIEVMLFTLQRYEFFSKSQQVPYMIESVVWCCLPYKGTNFSANHNIW